MGQIKNIKLHIVTDIKLHNTVCGWLYNITEHSKLRVRWKKTSRGGEKMFKMASQKTWSIFLRSCFTFYCSDVAHGTRITCGTGNCGTGITCGTGNCGTGNTCGTGNCGTGITCGTRNCGTGITF